MSKSANLEARHQQMLELLSQGASIRTMARKMGYSEGTMRVYLHNMYRAIGVKNKTEAVIWHLGRTRAAEAAPQPEAAGGDGAMPPPVEAASFGDMALAEDLYTALGVMSTLLGPYGRMWEVALRMKGGAMDQKLLLRRAQSRLLWRALLRGDFAYGKTLHDQGLAERLVYESPADAVLAVMLLALGGYTAAAERHLGQLAGRRRGELGITARELNLLRAVQDLMHRRSAEAFSTLFAFTAESARSPLVRQLAMVALFHTYRETRDLERAKGTANALWVEATAALEQLEAMGERLAPPEASIPKPARATAREAGTTREKVAAVTR